jgi:rubrerythrin
MNRRFNSKSLIILMPLMLACILIFNGCKNDAPGGSSPHAKTMAALPVDIGKVPGSQRDREILRVAIIAELDAVNLYEQMASMTTDKNIKRILLDIAREEKTHVGEFQAMLLRIDREQEKELQKGQKEVDELMK